MLDVIKEFFLQRRIFALSTGRRILKKNNFPIVEDDNELLNTLQKFIITALFSKMKQSDLLYYMNACSWLIHAKDCILMMQLEQRISIIEIIELLHNSYEETFSFILKDFSNKSLIDMAQSIIQGDSVVLMIEFDLELSKIIPKSNIQN